MARIKNYTLGRGKLFADFYDKTTGLLTGEFYIGNTTSLTYSSDEDNLDHFDSDDGVREKDDTVQLSDTASLGFTTDDVQPENLATFIKGALQTLAVMASVGETETFPVLRGRWYQLGVTDDTPTGARALDNLVVEVTIPAVQATGSYTFSTAPPAQDDTVTIGGHVITFRTAAPSGAQVLRGATPAEAATNLRAYINANAGTLGVSAGGAGAVVALIAEVAGAGGNAITTTAAFATGANVVVSAATLTGGVAVSSGALDADTNLVLDEDLGRVFVREDAPDVADGDSITPTYDIKASSRSIILSTGDKAVAALRYISANPKGPQRDHYWPKVVVSPDGDYELKGDDWQAMSFSGEAYKVTGRAKHYIDGRAAVTA